MLGQVGGARTLPCPRIRARRHDALIPEGGRWGTRPLPALPLSRLARRKPCALALALSLRDHGLDEGVPMPPCPPWQRYFGVFNVLTIFIILGIGADDIFVMLDTWTQSAEHYGEGSLWLRVSHVWKVSNLPLLPFRSLPLPPLIVPGRALPPLANGPSLSPHPCRH